MIGGEGRGEDRADAEHAVVRPGLLGDPAEADERDLRRVNDAEEGLAAEVAEVRDGDGAVAEFRTAQPPGAGARG